MARDFSFDAIGTRWTVEVFAPSLPAGLEAAVMQRIERFDRRYSRFRSDSWVMKLAAAAGDYTVPADGRTMLELYRQLYEVSEGAVTPLIGQALEDAGYDARYSLRPKTLRTVPDWNTVLRFEQGSLRLHQPAVLDFGALGKGRLVDLVATTMRRRHGARSFVVNAGGDLRHVDPDGPAIAVALEHPADPTMAIGVVHLNNRSLCGSAGNRRAWGGFHHIIDPHTRTSPRHLQAVWVTAATTMLADGLSTALYFVAPEVLRERFDFEYALVHHNGSLTYSSAFPAEFFV